MSEFVLDFLWRCDSLRDLVAHKVAELPTKTVNGHLHGTFRHPQLRRGLRVTPLWPVASQVRLESFELGVAAAAGRLRLEPGHHACEQRQCPTPVENPLRRLV